MGLGMLLWGVGAAALFGLAAIASRVLGTIVTDEVKAWCPHLTNKLIDLAVARAPETLREQLAEEWRSDVDQWPGQLSRIGRAAGFYIAAIRVPSSSKKHQVLRQPLRRNAAKLATTLLFTITGPSTAISVLISSMSGLSALLYALVTGRREYYGVALFIFSLELAVRFALRAVLRLRPHWAVALVKRVRG